MIIKFIKKYFLWLLVVPHLSGVIGMIFPASRAFFMSLTPVMLVFTFIVVFIEELEWTRTNIGAIVLIFLGGYFAEFFGTNYGVLFGEYTYGTVLGPKIFGVPVTIALNWAMLCIATRSLVNRYSNCSFIASVLAALIITAYDFILEPVAIKFDWWWWENVSVPAFNYFCWFGFTLLFQLFFRNVPQKTGSSFYILLVHILFYVILLLI